MVHQLHIIPRDTEEVRDGTGGVAVGSRGTDGESREKFPELLSCLGSPRRDAKEMTRLITK